MKTSLKQYSSLLAGVFFIFLTKEPAAQTSAGLKLPQGFQAAIAADNVGRARHLTVTPRGDIYVKLSRLSDGKGIVKLQDKDGDGLYEQTAAFGNYTGTGIYQKGNYLYASSDEEVFRYKLDGNGSVINPDKPERIITGLINKRQHESKSIVLDNEGNVYVNIGAYSNSCQIKDRQPGSMGMDNCPILEDAGGIWQFKADKLDQSYGDGVRYA